MSKIYLIRGQKVMLDRDLAVLYEVKSIRLHEKVKRNLQRFPESFMCRLTEILKEVNSYRVFLDHYINAITVYTKFFTPSFENTIFLSTINVTESFSNPSSNIIE